jgi:hypothetical protein
MGPGTGRSSAPTLTPADTLADLMGAGRAALGWAQDNPLDAAALAVSPVPVVGDIAGIANDVRHYVNEPETRTVSNALMSLMGLLPFVPSMAGAIGRAGGSFELDYFGQPIRILQNPSTQQQVGFLNRTKYKAARRIVDPETGDTYLWDANDPALHAMVAEQLGIKPGGKTIMDMIGLD